MTIMMVGFDYAMVEDMRRHGLEISVAFVKDNTIPASSASDCRYLPISTRFEPPATPLDPDLDPEFAKDFFRRRFSIYQRTFTREFFRRRFGGSSWLDPANQFHLALRLYHRLIREHAVSTVVFQIPPHEGTEIVLYDLAREMGLRTVVSFQSLIENAFFIAESVEEIGQSDVVGTYSGRIEIQEQPDTPFYMRSKRRYSSAELFRRIAPRYARLAVKAAVLQPLWNPRGFWKTWSKAGDELAMYRHQNRPESHYDRPDLEADFIYFALHLQPELSTDILGGDYADQLLALEELARFAPEQAVYAKEHPYQTSYMREESFFTRLRTLPQARYLHAEEPTLVLAKKAKAVATIVGTAGWEAVQMGKPVIAFGHAWYCGLPGVFKWSDGPEAALEGVRSFSFDAGKLRAALDAKAATLWTGVTDLVYAEMIENFDAEANRLAVIEAYRQYFERSAHLAAA